MNTRVSIWMLGLLLMATSVFAEKIQGNGKLITKEFSVSNYDAVSLMGSMDFEYSQSKASPKVKVTIDENLMPYVNVEVKGHCLEVNLRKGEHTLNYNTTTFVIVANSNALKDISMVGSGDFRIVTPLKVDKVEANMVGSGSIVFEKELSGRKADLNLTGSGEISAKNIRVETLDASLAGSGEIYLNGVVPRAHYSVAGSGELHAFDCKADKVEASVAGSGDVNAYAVNTLDASVVASSGSIRYKGDPTVNRSVTGSGSIKKQ